MEQRDTVGGYRTEGHRGWRGRRQIEKVEMEQRYNGGGDET